MKVAKIRTVVNANPQIVGNAHECWENCGNLSAHNAATFLDGTGLVFLSGINDDSGEFIAEQLDADERVEEYSIDEA